MRLALDEELRRAIAVVLRSFEERSVLARKLAEIFLDVLDFQCTLLQPVLFQVVIHGETPIIAGFGRQALGLYSSTRFAATETGASDLRLEPSPRAKLAFPCRCLFRARRRIERRRTATPPAAQ